MEVFCVDLYEQALSAERTAWMRVQLHGGKPFLDEWHEAADRVMGFALAIAAAKQRPDCDPPRL